MEKIKKILLGIIAILFLGIQNTFAYTSDDLLNFYYQGTTTIHDIYTVPDGYDFVLIHVYTDNKTNAELFAYDDGQIIAGGGFDAAENPVSMVFKTKVQMRDGAATNNYILTGILVEEGKEINNIVNGEDGNLNKPVFTEESIKEIYLLTAILMFLMVAWRTWKRILGIEGKRKLPML